LITNDRNRFLHDLYLRAVELGCKSERSPPRDLLVADQGPALDAVDKAIIAELGAITRTPP
jgi:hypothetical protein